MPRNHNPERDAQVDEVMAEMAVGMRPQIQPNLAYGVLNRYGELFALEARADWLTFLESSPGSSIPDIIESLYEIDQFSPTDRDIKSSEVLFYQRNVRLLTGISFVNTLISSALKHGVMSVDDIQKLGEIQENLMNASFHIEHLQKQTAFLLVQMLRDPQFDARAELQALRTQRLIIFNVFHLCSVILSETEN